MMTEPSRQTVEKYYDERVAEKLRDFTHSLPRVEAAINLIAEWAPSEPKRVLEIGCGVGATTWRMARAWPSAEVIGTDISSASVETAKKCFQLPNLSYLAGPANETNLSGKFDLILMMDVYEHIPPSHRAALHAGIKNLLSDDSRFILTVPTPANQELARRDYPEALQPVDEDIGILEIATLLNETSTKLLYYREQGVWHYGDYFHLVVGRYQHFASVKLQQPPQNGKAWLKSKLKRLLGRSETHDACKVDYLGTDMWHLRPNRNRHLFFVSVKERRQIASAAIKKMGIQPAGQ